ncbi:MAG: hypothetical protein ACTHLP_05090 [Rhizobiaceae bacterium]
MSSRIIYWPGDLMNGARERRFLTNSSNVPSGADTLNPEATMKDIAVPAKKIMFCVIIVICGMAMPE